MLINVLGKLYKQWATTIENYTTLKYFGINNKKTLEKFEEDRNKLSFQENDIILVSSTRYNTFTRYYSSYGIKKIFANVSLIKLTLSKFQVVKN